MQCHNENVAYEVARAAMKRKQRVRVLLDTNVWRYLVDQGANKDLLRSVRGGRVQIQIAPSVLYEALRTRDVDLRRRLASLMTLPTWKRLMPEAYSESQEILSEVRRLRPKWLRPTPDLNALRRFRFDWVRSRGGFWERVRLTPDKEAGYVAQLGDDDIARARRQADDRRKEFRDISCFETVALDSVYCDQLGSIPGWNGDRIEAWRGDAWYSTTRALQTPGHPYIDWLSPEIDISQLTQPGQSWVRFWFYEVSTKAMPRFWLRWAFEFLQRFRRVTEGTPCDAQLATYLPEADLVVSADKAFIQIANRCRVFAPCCFAETVLIPSGRQGVDALLSRLTE